MMARDINIKIRLAYINFKYRVAFYFTLWVLALLAALSLIIAGIFYQGSTTLKLWSAVLVILIFVKLGYDVHLNMRRQYERFKEMNHLPGPSLKDL